MEKLERRRKAGDVLYQLQQTMKDEHGGENQKPRKEERSQGRLITFGYPSERESSRQSDCHAVTYINPMSLCHVCLVLYGPLL